MSTDIDKLEEQANDGDSEAQYKLGARYYFGKGVNKSYSKAFDYLLASCKGGNADAQNLLGYMYASGLGLKEANFIKASVCFKNAALKEHPEGLYNLALLYQEGNYYSSKDSYSIQDYEKAIKLYERSIAYGNTDAQVNLGLMYMKGLGTNKNMKKAIQLIEDAARKGNTYGARIMSSMYYEGKYVQKDDKKAYKFLKDIADNTEIDNEEKAEVLYDLAFMYKKGIGIEENNDYATLLLKIAAESGSERAQNVLMYYDELDGQDMRIDIIDLISDAEKGDLKAQNLLAIYYQIGNGVEQSYEKALEWFERTETNGQTNYNAEILRKNRKENGLGKTYVIQSVAELADSGLFETFPDEFKAKFGTDYITRYGAVEIRPKYGYIPFVHGLYSIEDYIKIQKQVKGIKNHIIEDINDPDRSLKKFLKTIIMYGNQVELCDNETYTSQNLIGALIDRKTTRAGISEGLRNLLECNGISCRQVSNGNNTCNQVNIGGSWYYVDLAAELENIKRGKRLQFCLKGIESFDRQCSYKRQGIHVADISKKDYPQNKLNKAYKEIWEQYKNDPTFGVKTHYEEGEEQEI